VWPDQRPQTGRTQPASSRARSAPGNRGTPGIVARRPGNGSHPATARITLPDPTIHAILIEIAHHVSPVRKLVRGFPKGRTPGPRKGWFLQCSMEMHSRKRARWNQGTIVLASGTLTRLFSGWPQFRPRGSIRARASRRFVPRDTDLERLPSRSAVVAGSLLRATTTLAPWRFLLIAACCIGDVLSYCADKPRTRPQLDETTGAFMNTAAIMKNLDLVITSDTAIPHLAGGLGCPVWVALSLAAGWRWLLDRGRCPWYPTMRLFRQKE